MKDKSYTVAFYVSPKEVIVYHVEAAESKMHAKSLARQASVKAGDKFAEKVIVELAS